VPVESNNPASGNQSPPADAVALLVRVLGTCPARWLLVQVSRQRLLLIENDMISASWPVSTAAVGLDARQDSGGTPPGVHRIIQRIGLDMAPGTEFQSRQPTGTTHPLDNLPVACDRDLILSRILTLDGLQKGINRGGDLDSMKRTIYLHGTNREDLLGEPVSGGCVRLSNRDIITVCDLVLEGDPVVII